MVKPIIFTVNKTKVFQTNRQISQTDLSTIVNDGLKISFIFFFLIVGFWYLFSISTKTCTFPRVVPIVSVCGSKRKKKIIYEFMEGFLSQVSYSLLISMSCPFLKTQQPSEYFLPSLLCDMMKLIMIRKQEMVSQRYHQVTLTKRISFTQSDRVRLNEGEV